MPDALSIGLSALKAQQRALEVTSHNIANVATPGYTRQVAGISAASPENITPGQLGRGVDITAINRIANALTDERLRQAQGESGRLTLLQENLGVIENAFNEPGDNGIAQITNSLFSAFQDLSSNPGSVASRASTVQALQTWTSTVGGLSDRITGIRDDLFTSIEEEVASINDLAISIADLNRQIRAQVNLGRSPNDLLDRRNGLLTELNTHVQVNVRTSPADQGVTVDIDGHLLVGNDNVVLIDVERDADQGARLVEKDSRFGIDPSGGRVGAMMELYSEVIPGIQGQLDTFASTVAYHINAIHAVGTSDAFSAQSFTSGYTIPVGNDALDLDDPLHVQPGLGEAGIPESFLPSFTDADGTLGTRNLTINVLDEGTGVARKYTLRYEGVGNRSLDDLVSAINTGRGGGFTLYPPGSAGVDGVTAHKIQVDGGYRLEIATSASGTSIDFSQALDNRISAEVWTGATTTLSGTASIPASRLEVSVDGDGSTVRVSYRDPADGRTISLGTAAVPATGTAAATFASLTLTVAAGTYRAGDSFGVDLGSGGQVLDAAGAVGAHSQGREWVAADSTVTVEGRYTGSLTYDPSRPWSMKVLTAGVVGADSTAAAPNNPPQVQFTYWTGDSASPVQQTVVKTLDKSLAAGTPVEVADGVFVRFGAGSLSTVGSTLEFTVDGQPDQAGLLPALGINQLFSGGERASTISVSADVLADSNRLAVATSRSEGDNSNLTAIIGVRSRKYFDGGSFAMDDYYQGMVSGVGVRVQQASRLGENQDALVTSLSNQRDQFSGVNLDEEVGAMIMQQQAYSAAARIITTVRENMQTLLQILN